MRKRAKAYLITISCISLVIFAILNFFFIRRQAISASQQSLNNYLSSTIVLADFPDEPQQFVVSLAQSYSSNLRITIIARNGEVIGDSYTSPHRMENHLNREEVTQAFQTGYGSSLRSSDTTGTDTLYIAQIWHDDYVLRFSMPISASSEFANQMLPVLLVTLLMLCILIAATVEQYAKRLTKPYEQMLVHIEKMVQGEGSIDDVSFTVEYDEMQPIVQYFHYLLEQISEHIAQITNKTTEIETIIGNMREGLILLDDSMNILMINPQASQFLSVPQNSWQKQITYLYRAPSFTSAVQTAQQTGAHQMVDVDDNGMIYRFYINPVPDGGYVMLISDVTDIVRLERIRSDFVANVSHELKTPLTSISGFAELIITGMVDGQETIRDYAGKIHLESQRLVRLLDDILHLSSIENTAVSKEVTREIVNVRSIFSYVLQLLDAQIQEKDLYTEVIGDINLNIGRDHLQELALNLCDNGVKYNRQGGKLTIALNENGFSVSDTGIGIPAEHHKRIFERFYRADKARSRKTGGTGLGLSICKHIAALYGGSITVSSTDNGSTFTVTFPRSLVF